MNYNAYPVSALKFESIIKDEVDLVSPLLALVLPTHQMAVHQHDACVIELEPHQYGALVARGASQSGLDLGRLHVAHPREQFLLHE